MAKKLGANPAWLLRTISRGQTKGWRWEMDTSNDRYRIIHLKKDPKAA